MNLDLCLVIYGQLIEPFALFERADSRGQIEIEKELICNGEEWAEDEDRPARTHVANVGSLSDIRYRETVDATLH